MPTSSPRVFTGPSTKAKSPTSTPPSDWLCPSSFSLPHRIPPQNSQGTPASSFSKPQLRQDHQPFVLSNAAMAITDRSRRSLQRINYADAGYESSDSDDLVPYTPQPSTRQTPVPTLDADGDVVIEDVDSVASDESEQEPEDDVDPDDPEAVFESRNRHYDPTVAGFLSLPYELRLTIYKLALVKKPSVDFGSRRGFQHSSGLLSTCKTIAEEASLVLYGMNRFIFRPSKHLVGPYYQEDWRWLGYSCILRFLKDIGPMNASNLKRIGLTFQDATPSDEPYCSSEDRRFQHNADLYRCLEILVKRATNLEMIKLQFNGREKFIRTRNSGARNFGNLLMKLHADVIIISEIRSEEYDTAELWPIENGHQGSILSGQMGQWTQYWNENRIPQQDEDYLIKRMKRIEPLNPRLQAKHDKAMDVFIAEGRRRRAHSQYF